MKASLDCREYEALQKRGFKPYSLGHRIMYETALTLMTRSQKSPEKFAIIEAGFGIGWGLDRMIETGVIGRYVGYEPDHASFEYVAKRHGKNERVSLFNSRFAFDENPTPEFDHAFCIEVIEHVPPAEQQGVLVSLRQACRGTLWFSTADSGRSEHGVRTAESWKRFIRAAGFSNIVHLTPQWTDLYVCQ